MPVIRHVESHSVATLAAEISRLKGLAMEGKLAPEDLRGGVLTVSNIGAMGGGGVVAGRVVEGQVCMVGVGRSRKVPVWIEDEDGEAGQGGGGMHGKRERGETGGRVEGREEVVLSWSADHRVVDGREVAEFSGRVRRLLERPGEMLVGLK